MTIKELCSGCKMLQDPILDCGPIFDTAIYSEMAIEYKGETLYLVCHWCEEFSETMLFDANKQSSLLEPVECVTDPQENIERIEGLSNIENSVFYEQYKKLALMVFDKMIDEGYDICVRNRHTCEVK